MHIHTKIIDTVWCVLLCGFFFYFDFSCCTTQSGGWAMFMFLDQWFRIDMENLK